MNEPLGIVKMGIFCPVGLDTEQAVASIWAGVPGKRESGIQSRRTGAVVMGLLPQNVLPALVDSLEARGAELSDLQRRLLRLATPALQEVFELGLPPGLVSLPLLVAGPQPSPEQPEIVSEAFVEQATLQAGVPIDPSTSRVFATGRAGFFAALRYARREVFDAGRAELAVIGGVDSYVDLDRVLLLEQEERLKTYGPQDAFTPGEASAFMLVAPRQVCRRRGLKPLAWIEAVGVADEPGHLYSDEPHRGDGLAQALSQVFHRGGDAAPFPPVHLVMAGLNGERLPAKEWGVAYLRNRKHFAEGFRVEHSAEYTGDAGAALAPLMLGVAVSAQRDHHVEGPALVWACSDHGQRGALLVQAA